MSTTSANLDYEQAGELKIGQVGIANLRVRTLDVAQLSREMRERVERAPKLFGRAPVIVDFGGLAKMPDVATAKALLEGLRTAGVLPVGLSYGTRETEQLAEQLGFADHLSKKTNQLSQGEQQRVSIARALMNNPAVILADEPTSSLDDINCDKVIELLKNQSEQIGASLVVVTHDQRLKDAFAKQVKL